MNFLRSGAGERLLGKPALRPLIDEAQPRRRPGNMDIVLDSQIGDERKLLKNAGNARRVGRRRVAKGDGPPRA